MQCPNPDVVAGQLASIRNIYLRQEIYTISHQIQQHYKDRLPALPLVSLAAYEQVFNRQVLDLFGEMNNTLPFNYEKPLSSPEELRREAVRYGRKYYELNLEKLHLAEARVDRRRALDPAGDIQRDANQLDRASFPTAPNEASTREQSTLLVPSPASTSLSKKKSKRSIQSTKSTGVSSSKNTPKRNESPKIIVHKASEKSLMTNKSTKSTTDAKNKKGSKVNRSSSSKKRPRKKLSKRFRSKRRR